MNTEPFMLEAVQCIKNLNIKRFDSFDQVENVLKSFLNLTKSELIQDHQKVKLKIQREDFVCVLDVIDISQLISYITLLGELGERYTKKDRARMIETILYKTAWFMIGH